MAYTRLLILTTVLAAVAANIVNHSACSGVSDDICSVTQVRMDPCKRPKRCKLILGNNATLSFDFTPKFSAENLETEVYYRDLPVTSALGVTKMTGCDVISCPATSGVSQTFNYHLHTAKRLPVGTFPVSWVLFNRNNPEQMCCFVINIRLKKKYHYY